MAELLRWPAEDFRKAMREVLLQGLVKADFSAPLIWLPKAIFHNPPQSPNVVKSWEWAWHDLPECELKVAAWEGLRDYLEGRADAFRKAFEKTCRKPYLNQDRDKDRDKEEETNGQGPFLFSSLVESLPLEVAEGNARARGGPAAVPDWVPPARELPAGMDRRECAAFIVAVIQEITRRECDPRRCAGSARSVIALWRAVGKPSPAEFRAQAALVARAARESPEPIFAHDIRAEGWPDGTNRSNSVATLLVQLRWDERLAAAERWAAGSAARSEASDPHSDRRHGMRSPHKRGERWCSRAGGWVPEGEWKPIDPPGGTT
jgi:hypothetical protein